MNQTSLISTTPANTFASAPTLPRAGWTLFRNGSTEPHFLVLQQVQRHPLRGRAPRLDQVAHGLGLTCTAEGVETDGQLALLRSLGCDVAQGYLIARPLEPSRLKAWTGEWAKRWPGYASAECALA